MGDKEQADSVGKKYELLSHSDVYYGTVTMNRQERAVVEAEAQALDPVSQIFGDVARSASKINESAESQLRYESEHVSDSRDTEVTALILACDDVRHGVGDLYGDCVFASTSSAIEHIATNLELFHQLFHRWCGLIEEELEEIQESNIAESLREELQLERKRFAVFYSKAAQLTPVHATLELHLKYLEFLHFPPELNTSSKTDAICRLRLERNRYFESPSAELILEYLKQMEPLAKEAKVHWASSADGSIIKSLKSFDQMTTELEVASMLHGIG